MGIAAYNRGSRALSISISRELHGTAPEDRPARKPTPRPAEWGQKVLARAVERARRVIRCNRLYGREVSDENVAAIVVERERCSMPTAVEATRIVRAEPTAAKE